MDPLVLIRVRAALDRTLRGAVLRGIRDEPPWRVRLSFEASDRIASVLISLRPELPWIGRPTANAGKRRERPTPFTAAAWRALEGRIVEAVDPVGEGRAVALSFTGGARLVAELATHGANLLLLDPGGVVLVAARSPAAARERLAPGAVYRNRALPAGLPAAMTASVVELQASIGAALAAGEPLLEALRRRVFGVGSAGARLVVDEARHSGLDPAAVLAARVRALIAGEIDPVVVSPVADPVGAANAGDLELDQLQLLPWPPASTGLGSQLVAGFDAAATAGIYHEALETLLATERRLTALRGILRREIRRVEEARDRALRDGASFDDPDRYRRYGEAVLAGITRARRLGDTVVVPDPYDPEGPELRVPAAGHLRLPEVADEQFRKHRRAKRGIAGAAARAEAMAARHASLTAIDASVPDAASVEAAGRLEQAMLAQRIPVGLTPRAPNAQPATRRAPPRLEGVRVVKSSDDITILIGRTGKDNDRLTFRLAAPEDFWLHAAGFPGAHVVIRNERNEARPPQATLQEAAAAAAWFSDARAQGLVDVHWTKRKNVRRARGGAPGAVTLKRFETVRVRPGPPRSSDDEP